MRGPGRPDPGTQDDDEHTRIYHPDPVELGPSIDVEITDNPVIATLLGPAGEVLVEIRSRPTLPFGFQQPRA